MSSFPSDRAALLEEHRATISLLQAMYPLESELELSADTALLLEPESDLSSPSAAQATSLDFTITVLIEDDPNRPLSYAVALGLPPANDSTPKGDRDLCLCSVTLRHPPYLSRGEHEALRALIEPYADSSAAGAGEYVLDILDRVPPAVVDVLAARPTTSDHTDASALPVDPGSDTLERVWFWFPSLSSKEKRRDLVDFGQEAGLTGFVLAGKPGLLCVEGSSTGIDRYMARIKSESWRDIPPGHKKVSERLRTPLASLDFAGVGVGAGASAPRLLPPLIDISDEIPRYGTYAHRAEMGEVRRIVDRWSAVVGDEMGRVLMA